MADRKCQRLIGKASGLLLAIALLGLIDGLIAQMRHGTNELELLPGQSIIISGPVAIKNPLTKDLIAHFSPEDAPLGFDLEGYFTGYWFGSGMWRGKIIAATEAAPGVYSLRIAFRGQSSQSAQNYSVRIFADATSLKAASFSFLYRWLDINPFILAAASGLGGIVLGLVTWWFGSRFYQALSTLGLSEIYLQEPDNSVIWCLATKDLAPTPGLARMVLDADGHVFGEARSIIWNKGKLKLTLMDEREIPKGALVCLRHPAASANRRQSGSPVK